MKAEEARRLADKNLKGPVIAPILAHIYQRIREAAEHGKRSITDPGFGVSPRPSPDQQQAVLDQLRQDGYKVTHHECAPSRDPREHAWDEISW